MRLFVIDVMSLCIHLDCVELLDFLQLMMEGNFRPNQLLMVEQQSNKIQVWIYVTATI